MPNESETISEVSLWSNPADRWPAPRRRNLRDYSVTPEQVGAAIESRDEQNELFSAERLTAGWNSCQGIRAACDRP